MMKTSRKFNSLEEMNMFLQDGKTVYSIANCGSIWFIEYDESITMNESDKKESIESIINNMIENKVIEKCPSSSGDYEISDHLKFRTIASTLEKCDLEIIKPAFFWSTDKMVINRIINTKQSNY